MTFTEILDTATTLAVTGVLVAPVVYLLERTHRRASLDAGGRADRWLRAHDVDDADARRLAADLRAAQPTPAEPQAGAPTRSAVRCPAVPAAQVR
ncbi:hypothetical protein KMZ32_17810 [Phycicoccus sp. MAQZ13P-2]|uniref:hypothetical protein n=1 Tax=Phycicoccus mangrovi TaxID=2840470 RepID=UPI001BFFF671|nr:hypothetical protein [Phycicoccus mangrovi]MBT9256396.1 hypothetical protein [Phycicoccus mangrovi]MBT9275934.1 hypothetical protein [Phycicoccus mangrovi]